jgi:hypothetical protein
VAAPRSYHYTDEDHMNPVFCISCRAHIPTALSNTNRGLCLECGQPAHQYAPAYAVPREYYVADVVCGVVIGCLAVAYFLLSRPAIDPFSIGFHLVMMGSGIGIALGHKAAFIVWIVYGCYFTLCGGAGLGFSLMMMDAMPHVPKPQDSGLALLVAFLATQLVFLIYAVARISGMGPRFQ